MLGLSPRKIFPPFLTVQITPRRVALLSTPPTKNISLRLLVDAALLIPTVPPRHEGRFAIVTNAGRDAVDADGAFDEWRMKRTAKSCGSDVPTLTSGATRERCHPRRQPSPVSGASTKETVKPLRGECRVFRCDRGDYACVLSFRTQGCGRGGRPAFPAPLDPLRVGRLR